MTRTELLEHYLKPTAISVEELIDRNAFAQIMQFAEAYHIEQLRTGGVSQPRELLLDFADYVENDKISRTTDECVDNYLDSICKHELYYILLLTKMIN